ncbi:M23 family metallopeptidase [Protaetiibacter mangrovi]|uniref:M23 family metallopeptidase n=1 Tax=Protaetiibacter mangrovi TaxID=2970926 RepID=A0ABT1ZIJ8_9MICO|nr:M23 family metallopeptidase [Protaetiibacter mangrovi]MCS0500549.1 M23 family metallopeptidase [Protaetiibacter mangrovi]TPX04181.1 M23 family metallopeptidase [Schumannella luteola]
MPHPLHPATRASDLRAAHHLPLGIFRGISRRRLAVGTVALSMALIVVHDLPASATAIEPAEPTVVGQQLTLSAANLAQSEAALPLPTERDDIALSYYTPIQWPVAPTSPITSLFGYRSAPCAGCSTQHSGIDFTPGYGTAIHAIADGVVVSRPMEGWGSYVVIQHEIDGQIVYSGYAHMISGSNVPVGTVVHRGDVIGRVGSTGESTGAHLHFSIIVGDTFVDPLSWMRTKVTEAWVG